MVDLIADNGHTAWMISDIELCLGALADDLLTPDSLAYIGREQIIKHATDLVHEAWAEVK